jgi:hypothetical protein
MYILDIDNAWDIWDMMHFKKGWKVRQQICQQNINKEDTNQYFNKNAEIKTFEVELILTKDSRC